MRTIVDVFTAVEEGTTLVVCQSAPTNHPKDVCCAGILAFLEKEKDQNVIDSQTKRLAYVLSELFLTRNSRNNQKCRILGHCVHVATLLIPKFCKIRGNFFLRVIHAYSLSDIAAVRVMLRIADKYLQASALSSIKNADKNASDTRKQTVINIFGSDDEYTRIVQEMNVSIGSELNLYKCVSSTAKDMKQLDLWRKYQSNLRFYLLWHVFSSPRTHHRLHWKSISSVVLSFRSKWRSRLKACLTECLLKATDYLKRHKHVPGESGYTY